MKPFILLTSLGLLACATPGTAIEGYVLRESLAIDLSEADAQSLEVLLRKGHVLVSSGEELACRLYVDITADNEVAARGLASGLRLSYEIDTDADHQSRLRLVLEHDQVAALDSTNAFYRLTVPPSMDLDILTSHADVTLRSYRGKVRVRTNSGRIRADMDSSVACTLVNRSGSTELTGLYSEVEIRSVQGAIIADLPLGNSDAAVRLDMFSKSGTIILRATENDDLAMTYDTDRGRIRSDLPLRWTSSGQLGDRRSHFVGGLGEQSGRVEVRVESESSVLQVMRRANSAVIGSAQGSDQLLDELGNQPATRLGSQ